MTKERQARYTSLVNDSISYIRKKKMYKERTLTSLKCSCRFLQKVMIKNNISELNCVNANKLVKLVQQQPNGKGLVTAINRLAEIEQLSRLIKLKRNHKRFC